MNLDPEYWKRKFLFPYANAGVNLSQYQSTATAQLGSGDTLQQAPEVVPPGAVDMFVDKGEFKFPLSEIKIQRQKVLQELQVPLKVTIEEIALDLHKFVREFPVDSIPHVEGPDVSKAEGQGPTSPPHKGAEKPSITAEDINKALHEVDSEHMARLIGLIGHMVYWCVFGHVNQLPLDEYHKK